MPFSSTLAGVAAFLLFTIGVTVSALTAHGLDSTGDFAGRGTSNLRGSLRGHDLSLLPEHYEKSSSYVIVGAGVVAGITGLMGLLDVVFKVTEGATSEAFYATLINAVLGFLSIALSLSALVYGMIAQYQSSAWLYDGIDTPNGRYTVEGWACQMKDVMVDHEEEFGTVCNESKAARFLTIFLLLCSVTFTIGSFLREKTRRANTQRSRSTPGYLKEDELEFF